MKQRKTVLKRCLALMLVLVLSISLFPMADTSAKKSKSTVTMKEKKIMMYQKSAAYCGEDSVFFCGKSDVPYTELESCKLLVESTLMQLNPSGLTLKSKAKGNTVTWTRTSGGLSFRVIFDFKKNTITFDDLDGFFRVEGLSLVGAEYGLQNFSGLFQSGENNYNRYGKTYVINLNQYGIKLLRDKKKYYIPLQTFSDIFLTKFLNYVVYNGESIILNGGGSELPEDLEEVYRKAPAKSQSKAYAAFNYGELCLVLDYLYGLKETHDIRSFDEFFTETGLGSLIKGRDTFGTDMALNMAIQMYFDDLHCNYGEPSYATNQDQLKEQLAIIPPGAYRTRALGTLEELKGYRKKYAPDGIAPYQEVGDTAYITFDEFTVDETQDHTVLPTDADLPNLGKDTLRLVQYAMKQITRAGSPVKRVVVDLSLNAGGAIFAGIYLLSAMLGSSALAERDMVTGAQSVADYKADTNLDGVFDEKDTLAGKGLDLYCLTSGFSYSCANLVAAVFKDSGKVQLVGRTSGGGSCSVCYASTASGTIFQLSSPSRFSFSKNGGFYDVDRGAEPDVLVKDMSKLYDREYMNKFLDDVR